MTALQTKVQEYLDLTKIEQEGTLQRLHDLQLDDDNDDDDEDDDDRAQRTLAIKEVKKRSGVVEAAQVSLGVIYLQVQSARSGAKIGNVTIAKNSRGLVGLPESVVGNIDLTIGDVSMTENSAGAVGVFDKDVDMRTFFITGK